MVSIALFTTTRMPIEVQLTDVPSALEEYITLPILGGDLIVFEGQFTLNSGEIECAVSGKVFYSFCETIELMFEGTAIINDPIAWIGKHALIEAGDSLLGEALVLQIQGDRIRGYITHLANKQSTSCERFRWCYLNAPKLFGDIVKRGRNISMDRLVFQDGEYQIIFENVAGYQEQKNHRAISHFCELTRSDGRLIPIEAALDEIQLFSRFVSFIAGCQHAPFFIEGVDDDTVSYAFHAIAHDRSLVGVSSWRPDFKDKDLIALWPKFRAKREESPDQYDALNAVVHWYLSANMNDGLLEGAYILGFAGIQLLSYEIVGKELDSNKEIIDDLFTRLNLNAHMDAGDISSMRNWLTHYVSKNRVDYQGLGRDDKCTRLEVLLQVLELAILYWLGYEGHFSNRLGPKWLGEAVAMVPWLSPINKSSI